MANFKLMTTAEFGKMCDDIMRRQKKTDDDLQRLAVTAVVYSIEHGDVQPANRLLAAMQRSLRRDSMVKYLEKHGKLAYLKSDEKFGFYKDGRDTYDVTALMALKWYDAKKENVIVSEYDLQAAFDKFMKTIQRKMEDGNITIKNGKLYDLLAEASAEYSATAHVEAAEGGE